MKNLLNFAVAKIRVKEAKLLNETAFLRLSQAKDTEYFIKLLAELNYSGSENIDEILTNALINTYHYVKEAVGNGDILYPFLQKYDLFNIGVYLKAELSNKDYVIEKLPFVPLGTIEVPVLVKSLKNREKFAPSEFLTAFLEARELYVSTLDIALAQIHLEKSCYEHIMSGINLIKSDFVRTYFKTEIDLKNVVFSLRLKRIHSDELVKRVLIDGGTVAVHAIIKAFNGGIGDLKDLFIKSLDTKVIDEVFAKYEAGKPFAELEKELRKILEKQIDKTKITPFGIDPIIAYVLRKEVEIKKIRALYYTALANQANPAS